MRPASTGGRPFLPRLADRTGEQTVQARLEEGAALVFAEDVAHRAADLADRGVGGERGADRVQEVALAAGDVAQRLQLGLDRGLVAVLLEGLEPRQLALLGLGVDLEDVDVVDLVGDEFVDADDDVLAALVALVVARAPTPRSRAA